MPRFKTLQGQQSFREACAVNKTRRREVWADLLWDVIPKKEEDALPKRMLANLAVQSYKADPESATNGDPFLDTHSDKFINPKACMTYWADVKDILAQQGKFIGIVFGRGGGVYGTRRKAAIASALEAHQRGILASAERYNWRAEYANTKRKTQLPTLAVQVALPPPVGE